MLRRRILNTGITVLPVTLSSYSYSATPASGRKTVTAYYGGVAITDLTASMITTGGNMSSVSVSSSGVITMNYSWNTNRSSTKSSTMTLTYQDQSVTFTITQAKDYATNTVEKSSVTTTCSVPSTSTLTLTDMRNYYDIGNSCEYYETVWKYTASALSEVTQTCYYDRITYASGNVVDSSCKRTDTSITTKNDVELMMDFRYSDSYNIGTTYGAPILNLKYNGKVVTTVNNFKFTCTSQGTYYESECGKKLPTYVCNITYNWNGTKTVSNFPITTGIIF